MYCRSTMAIRGTVGTHEIRIGRPLQGECRISLRPETITKQRWPVPGHCKIRDSIDEIGHLGRGLELQQDEQAQR